MTIPALISRLSGELLVEESLIFEAIREDQDLIHLVRSYREGDFTYAEVLDTLKDYF
jgi:hypothetical protein